MRQETLKRHKTILLILIAVAVCTAFTLPAQTEFSYAKTKKPGRVVLKTLKAKSKTSVEIKWKKTSGAKGYQVYRTKGNSKKFKKIKTIKKKGTCKMTDKGLKAGTKYTYKVRAYKKVKGKAVYGKYSGTKSVTTKGTKALAQVEFTSAKAKSASTIKLVWKKVSGAQGYQVYRCDATMNYSFLVSLDSSSTEFIDTGLDPYSTYGYKIRAFRTSGGKNVYGKFSRERFDRTKEQTEPVVVDPETPQTEDPVIQDPQTPEVTDATLREIMGEHPEINVSYQGTTIYIGQPWTENLKNEISGKSSGMEMVTRKDMYYNYVKTYVSPTNNAIAAQKKTDLYDSDLYMFDIGDYDNFLLVYVEQGQVRGWITNMEDMGECNGKHLRQGAMPEDYPKNAVSHYKNSLKLSFQNAPNAGEGVLIGRFLLNYDQDEQGRRIFAKYRNPDYKQNIPGEKRVAMHTINALRYLYGARALSYNDTFDGTGMTFTGYSVLLEREFTDQLFGAQAWAETMNASKRCAHSGPMPKGPLATINNVGGKYTALAEEALNWEINRYGENCGECDPFGEFFAENYENSIGHVSPMLDKDCKYIAIGVSGNYHIEDYLGDGMTKPDYGYPDPVIKYNQWEASSDY